jgi:hypothetical protein
MICQTCKRAGDHNVNHDYKKAATLHKKCEWPGSGCFCQHGTGDYIRKP